MTAARQLNFGAGLDPAELAWRRNAARTEVARITPLLALLVTECGPRREDAWVQAVEDWCESVAYEAFGLHIDEVRDAWADQVRQEREALFPAGTARAAE